MHGTKPYIRIAQAEYKEQIEQQTFSFHGFLFTFQTKVYRFSSLFRKKEIKIHSKNKCPPNRKNCPPQEEQ